MIAVRLLPRELVAERLSRFGCTLVEELENPEDEYYSASYWRTSWGFHFTVPQVGADKLCPEKRLFEIMVELAELEPDNSS